VVNTAVVAVLRRVFPVTRVRRDGSELTITLVLGSEQASLPTEDLVA
jgi:hypothetical protein